VEHDEDMSPQQQLLVGVAFNNVDLVRDGLAGGADPEAILENGNTLATEAILDGMGAPEALGLLIEHGVDLDRADANGITPWMACLARENATGWWPRRWPRFVRCWRWPVP
jgi:ankyrin repeat protein